MIKNHAFIKSGIRFFVLFLFLFSLIAPSSIALADDATPPQDSQVDTVTDEFDAEETGAGDPPGDDANEEATSAEEMDDPEHVDGEEDSVVADDNGVEALEVESLVGQLPDGTDMVVLDEDGNVEPLATQGAAEAVTSSDPMWCPDGVDPIANTGGCTDSYTSMADLLSALSGTGQPSQNGTIWIEKTYDSSIAEPGGTTNITINGNSHSTWRDYSLTVQGGWDGAGTNTITGTSLFFGDRLRIINWRSDVTVRDIVLDGASGGASLDIEIDTPGMNTFDVTIENVEAKNNKNNRGVRIDNDESTGSVTVNNSRFTDNGTGKNDDGLYIDARGNVNLLNVIATGNGDEGVEIINTDSKNQSTVQVLGTNIFSDNREYGLYIRSDGAISLNNLTANNSATRSGALIDNDEGGATSSSTVTIMGNNSFNGNGNGNNDDGLYIRSKGNISLNNITANNNKDDGADISNTASSVNAFVTITGSNSFSGNTDDGLNIRSDGNIELNEVTADGNGKGKGDNGADLDNSTGTGNIIISGYNNSFSNNAGPGLDIDSKGDVELYFAAITNNNQAGGGAGVLFDSSNAKQNSASVYCSVFENNQGYGLDAWKFKGSLTFNGQNLFAGNSSGDFRYNGTASFEDFDCSKPTPSVVSVDRSAKTTVDNLIIAVTSGQFLPISCEVESVVFRTSNGNSVTFDNLCDYEVLLDEVIETELPKALPNGGLYVSGLNLVLAQDGNMIVEPLPVGASMTVAIKIPDGMEDENFTILHWDGSDWVEETASLDNGFMKATVGSTGIYLLVLK